MIEHQHQAAFQHSLPALIGYLIDRDLQTKDHNHGSEQRKGFERTKETQTVFFNVIYGIHTGQASYEVFSYYDMLQHDRYRLTVTA